MSHELLLQDLLSLSALWIVGELINSSSISSNRFGYLIDLWFEGILRVDLLLNNLSYDLLLPVISRIESLDSILRCLSSTSWITFYYNLRCGIDLWFETVSLFIRPHLSCLKFVLMLSLYKGILSIMKVFHVTIEHV